MIGVGYNRGWLLYSLYESWLEIAGGVAIG